MIKKYAPTEKIKLIFANYENQNYDFLQPIYVFFNQNCLNITLKMGKIMASSKKFLDFIVDQLSELNEVSYRA